MSYDKSEIFTFPIKLMTFSKKLINNNTGKIENVDYHDILSHNQKTKF